MVVKLTYNLNLINRLLVIYSSYNYLNYALSICTNSPQKVTVSYYFDFVFSNFMKLGNFTIIVWGTYNMA